MSYILDAFTGNKDQRIHQLYCGHMAHRLAAGVISCREAYYILDLLLADWLLTLMNGQLILLSRTLFPMCVQCRDLNMQFKRWWLLQSDSFCAGGPMANLVQGLTHWLCNVYVSEPAMCDSACRDH